MRISNQEKNYDKLQNLFILKDSFIIIYKKIKKILNNKVVTMKNNLDKLK